ncbi:MAG TPA: peptide deformylase [Armatimonadaceae bacterium]|nr:peptide deformylase [Armatimonadaceae bacterium]
MPTRIVGRKKAPVKIAPLRGEPHRSSKAAQQKAEALSDKYENIPFDDSRVVKYRETSGWEVLRQVCAPVSEVTDEVRALAAEMGDIMYRAHGVGLAAPQVGKSIRLVTYDAGEGLTALLNPEILKMKGEQYEPEEGCLSIPGLRGVVKRANEIVVKAMTLEGKPLQFRAREFEARILQHEIDHLDGVLFIDRAAPETLHMLTPAEERGEAGEPAPAE